MTTYLITFKTHNSRTSMRMKSFGIRPGEAVRFSLEDRLLLKGFLLSIVNEFTESVSILAFNVLDDHVHLVATMLSDNLSNFVRKLKGKSTHLYKKHHAIEKEFHLWARKFNRRILVSEESKQRAIHYVEKNHLKHKLEKVL